MNIENLFEHINDSNLRTLAKQIFLKVPHDYLSNKTNEELEHIAKTSSEIYKKFCSTKKLSYEIKFQDNSFYLWIAQGDRPFIVNTISELIKSLGGNILLYLHPIINYNDLRVSLNFIEFNGIVEDKKKQICDLIEYKIKLLEKVTDDYSDILFELKKTIFESKDIGINEFLEWIIDGNFVFLGATIKTNQYGILKEERFVNDIFKQLISINEINLTKLNILSPVHRSSPLIAFTVTKLNLVLIGLFTSKALGHESSSIPFIKNKIKVVLEKENVLSNSYDYASIMDILNSMPKDELFSIPVDELINNLRTIQSIQDSKTTKVSIRFDSNKKGISSLILIPKNSFNAKIRDQIQKLLESKFEASNSQYQLDFTGETHARLYFYIPSVSTLNTDVNLLELQEMISKITKTWIDELQEKIKDSDTIQLFNKLKEFFPEKYKNNTSIDQALIDIDYLKGLDKSPILADIQNNNFTIYSKCFLALSDLMQLLENIGFYVISEETNKIGDYFIHRFEVKLSDDFNLANFKSEICDNFNKIITSGNSEKSLLSLCAKTNLSLESIRLLKAYADYFWQINKFATRMTIYETLARNPIVSNLFWDYFNSKFNPNIAKEISLESIISQIRKISDSTTDRILKIILDLMVNTVRTNFFISDDGVAIKINAEKCSSILAPKPLYEIYVSAEDFEGIHLRSSKVSRGGIRWSDRIQDYRTEILGLMRTQKTKNAVIVPTGAKGGFVIKDQTKSGKEYFELGKSIYKRYIRNLLSLSDNIINNQIITNKNLICYDDQDPYFVVAADKGTASFSDLANEIAVKEYDFWLGDAFASGGSLGYDHKKYGITARGAFKCAERHFIDLGIDYQNSDFTAIGIGDMSGDVFGNGLILSDKFKLIAAFNHKHIFIDPNPDSQNSFKERLRLFNLSGSQWSDYSILSTGGAVYNRTDKEITLSKEACNSLGLNYPLILSADELVSNILKAPVDIIWNGGIGTYFKASSEQNSTVNDSNNDLVRVDANQVKAKIISEGGNLGLTHKARIEFEKNGGFINTDAIDNSAGVDLSDHEVNLKILFSQLISKNKITIEERNKILLEVADEVCEQVLEHNSSHALILTIGKLRSVINNNYLSSLITQISSQGYINRSAEQLPDDQELESRLANNLGLMRPELAVVLAGTKLQIKNEILNSTIIDDPYLEKYLLDYFPEKIRNEFSDEIKNHKLKREIIATEVTNRLLDAVGITFIHRMCLNYHVSIVSVVKATIIAIEILDSFKLKQDFLIYDKVGSVEKFLELTHELGKATRDLTAWLVKSKIDNNSFEENILTLKTSFNNILNNNFDSLINNFKDLSERYKYYNDFNLNQNSIKNLVVFQKLNLILEVINICLKNNSNFELILDKYIKIDDLTLFSKIINAGSNLKDLNKWDYELQLSSLDLIWDSISKLVLKNEIDLSNIKAIGSEILRRTPTPSAFFSFAKELNKKTLD